VVEPREIGGGSEDGGVNPLLQHLDVLENAVLEWLERSFYETADHELQKALRKQALLPVNMQAEMPEAYRIWRTCQRHSELFWPGGIANQPATLMLEMEACERVSNQFQDQIKRMYGIIEDKGSGASPIG